MYICIAMIVKALLLFVVYQYFVNPLCPAIHIAVKKGLEMLFVS